MKSTALLLGALVLGVAGCADGGTGPQQEGESSVAFTYGGPVVGQFAAKGTPRLSVPPLSQTYAHGLRYTNPNTIEVSGILQRPGNTVDGIFVTIPRQRVGSVTIDANACPSWDDGCAALSVFFQLANEDGAQAKYSCHLETGVIRLVSSAEARVSGEFSGTGRCIEDTDSLEEIVEHEGFTITGGRFDVKVMPGTRG